MKSALELIKNISAWSIVWDGVHAGRLVVVYKSAVTVSMPIWAGPLAMSDTSKATARASGGGYCRASSAAYDIIHRFDKEAKDIAGAGIPRVIEYLEKKGYKVYEAI